MTRPRWRGGARAAAAAGVETASAGVPALVARITTLSETANELPLEALVAELTNGVEPLSNVTPTEGAPVVTSVAEVTGEPEAEEITSAADETIEPDVADASGVKNSLRPKPRPTQTQLENVVQELYGITFHNIFTLCLLWNIYFVCFVATSYSN